MSWGVENLTVRFGRHQALTAVTLGVGSGETHAVVGGDGAGKTTLLRALAGISLPAEGTIELPAPGRIGFVPSDGGVFRDLTVAENLEFVASAYGLRAWQARADELLGRSGLSDFRRRLAGNLSGGQRRKLAGSLAMLPEPDLLILDEVTTGVDPLSRVGIWRLVASAAASGAAVVIATTYLDEAERTGAVTILHRGRVIAAGPPSVIKNGVPGGIREVDRPTSPERAWRMGRRWREWVPAEADARGLAPATLQDAAIVAQLRSGEGQ